MKDNEIQRLKKAFSFAIGINNVELMCNFDEFVRIVKIIDQD